jgi:hypothetical protein
MARRGKRVAIALAIGGTLIGQLSAKNADAEDLSSIVAHAREQVENGAYAQAITTLATLPSHDVPQALAVEAGLLETTAALVSKGQAAGEAACAKAIVASGYDPEVARDQSPKVRAACRTAAAAERGKRVERAKVSFGDLMFDTPEVAWQPVRVSTTSTSTPPPWLHVIARVSSSALEGTFDLALAPSLEGPLRGTLDSSWIRPKAKISIDLIAQDKYGDLGPLGQHREITVPTAEALVALGDLPSGATVTVDDAKAEPTPQGKVAITPGAHTIALEIGDASASTKVDAQRGSVTSVALSPQRSTTRRTLAVIATGATVTLGVAGGVFLLVANSRKREIEELAAKREPGTGLPATSYADVQSKESDRKTFSTVGTALLIGGGATAVTALALWVWPSSGSGPAAKKTGSLTPLVGPGSLGLAGTF